MRTLFAVTLILMLALTAHALDPRRALNEYRQTIWTIKDGLPSTFIYSIAQSSDGYIWLGNADGLARFDGIQFFHWRSKENRILLGAVRVVRAARDRGVWVGTASGIVGRVQGDDITVATVDAPVEAMLEARDGSLWVATRKQIVRFHPETLAPTGSVINLPADFYSGLVQDESGLIWLSTSGGIEQIEPASGELRHPTFAEGKSWLSQDRGGTIWITKPDGQTVALKEKQLVSPAGRGTALDISAVVRDVHGNIWIGTSGKGLFRVRSGADSSLPEKFSRADGLSNDNVWSLFEDREHNLWVGTQDGLNCIRDGVVTTLNRGNESAADNVDALAAGPGSGVWAATSSGVNRVDAGSHELGLEGLRAKALFTDRDNTIWAGTSGGVFRMSKGRWSLLSLPRGLSLNNVVAIADD